MTPQITVLIGCILESCVGAACGFLIGVIYYDARIAYWKKRYDAADKMRTALENKFSRVQQKRDGKGRFK